MKYDLIAWGAELTPDRRAIWFQGRWYSYRDLNERATRLANHLAAQGVSYGDRIGLLASNHLAFFDLLLAAPKLGFVLVPFNRHMGVPQLRATLDAVQPSLVVADARHWSSAREAFSCPTASLELLRTWVSNGSREQVPAPELVPESAHMILFTSGTTGDPKATLVPYRQTIANAQNTAMGWDIGPEDCVIQATDCWHASVHSLALPLLTIGGSVVLASHFEPGDYLRMMQGCEASLLSLPPGMYRMLIAHPDFAYADLNGLRWALCGGAPFDPTVQRAFAERGVTMLQSYGMTEAGPNCFCIDVEDAKRRPDSVGFPLPHMRAQVIRADGTPCQDNEIGELLLAGEALSSGYLEDCQRWAEMFRQAWLRTGDIAWRDADGFYYVSGRRHEVYVERGEAVLPQEVERSIAECEDVQDCAVMGIPGAEHSQAVSALAAIVMRPGAKRSADSIRAALKPRLQPHMIPPVMLFLDQLPRDRMGEIDRRALREALLPDVFDEN